jgi:hypothetical protein
MFKDLMGHENIQKLRASLYKPDRVIKNENGSTTEIRSLPIKEDAKLKSIREMKPLDYLSALAYTTFAAGVAMVALPTYILGGIFGNSITESKGSKFCLEDYL